jgi:NADP-dependent 3-hydroxy acid dehydrogenase YdfG
LPPLPPPGRRGSPSSPEQPAGSASRSPLRLAVAGYTLALVGHEPELLKKVAAAGGGRALWWTADVTDSAALAAVAADVRERLGPVDILVVDAGIAQGSSLGSRTATPTTGCSR